MATHSSVLAWRIPGTGEPGGLPSMGSHRVGHSSRCFTTKHQHPTERTKIPVPQCWECSFTHRVVSIEAKNVPERLGSLNLSYRA